MQHPFLKGEVFRNKYDEKEDDLSILDITEENSSYVRLVLMREDRKTGNSSSIEEIIISVADWDSWELVEEKEIKPKKTRQKRIKK